MHTELGPGLLESDYEVVLTHELCECGLRVLWQVPVAINYEGLRFDEGYQIDLIGEDRVVVELKSIEDLSAVRKKQLLTYPRLADKRLGFRSTSTPDSSKTESTAS